MQTLTLTEQHKARLLEMAQHYFPELDIKFGKNDTYGDKNAEYVWSNENDIHWFQFTVVNLADKIITERYTGDLRPYFAEVAINAVMEILEGGPAGYDHPVDFLYKKFKQ